MKNKNHLVFLLLFIANSFFGLEFYINSGREENRNFAVLNLIDNVPFACVESYDRRNYTFFSLKFAFSLLNLQ